ncbi:M16 family metallopeptidase [Flavimarina sp. Hel_I_48]|uniref:M16 family metallopeptidase n=1 Tax=Flavimarina sp. Hel_I_48 TaxID=1392488 RepID=UPI0004DF5C06|nr:pitrilysin family protein [Flavimarina sp. Hel_I_48]
MKNILFSLLFISSLVATAQIDRSVQPKPGPAPEINLGVPETFSLDNGLKVIVVENHKLPRVTFNLSLDNPPVVEGEIAGVSSILSGMLGKGSSTIAKDAYNEEVDYLGASMNFSANGVSASGLSKYSERILELMSEAAIHPNFTQEEFDTERTKEKENLKSAEKSVPQVAAVVSQSLAYGKNTAKGEFETQESLDRVKLDDVKSFYNTNFLPNNAYLVVVGDVKSNKIKKQIKSNFKDWKKGNAPANDPASAKNLDNTTINFVDMPNAVQSEVIVENTIDLKMSDPDYFPAIIANQILGGGGEARLFQNLREDKGYTYGAYSSLGNSKFGSSLFSASASVRNVVTDSSVVAFLKEIQDFRKNKIKDIDLENAKARYVGSFVRSLEQPATIAQFAINIETENLPDDFYKTYLSKINAVTKEQVQTVAQKYFMLDNARIVVVGKGSEVLENLEKVQFKGKAIPITYYDKEANEVEKPSYESAIPEGITAQTVLNKYIETIGGEEKLKTVKSIVMMAAAEIQGMKLSMEMKKSDKGQFLQEIAMMGNVMSKQVYDGKEGYAMAQGQKMELSAEQLVAMKEEAALFPELDYLTAENTSLDGMQKVDGKDAYLVKVSDKKTNFYDAESGLKIKEVSTVEANGQTMTQALELGNYEAVDGILFPYMLSTSFGPQKVDFNVSEIMLNAGVKEDDFE